MWIELTAYIRLPRLGRRATDSSALGCFSRCWTDQLGGLEPAAASRNVTERFQEALLSPIVCVVVVVAVTACPLSRACVEMRVVGVVD
jgi:hypothetical protein